MARADSSTGYQVDAAHDGNQPSGLAPPLRRAWAVDLPWVLTNPQQSYPLIVGDSVFVTAWRSGAQCALYSLDLATGAVNWGPKDIGGDGHWSGLTYDNGTVFTVAGDGTVDAVDPATGATRWTSALNTRATSDPVTVAGRVVVVGDGVMFAVDETDGKVLWQRTISGGNHATPAVWDGKIFVSDVHQRTQAFSASGDLLWLHDSGFVGDGGRTVAVYDGKVYVRDDTGDTPIVLDAATGDQVGTFEATLLPAFSGSTGFFVDNGVLRAESLETGATLWRFADSVVSVAPVVAGGEVYAGTEAGELYALDASTGAVDWMTNVGAGFLTPEEHNSNAPLTGLGVAEGYLIAPVANGGAGCGMPEFELVAYKVDPGGPASVVPPNDDFAHGTVLPSVARCALNGTNLGATRELGEPDHAGAAGGASVWFTWTAPKSGNFDVRIVERTFKPILAAYTGSPPGPLVQVAEDAQDLDGSGFPGAIIHYEVTAGTTYHIALDAQTDPTTGLPGRGSFGLSFTFSEGRSPNSENDDFALPDRMVGSSGTVGAGNITATKEPGEPDHAGNPGGASVWWRWTAPASGPVTMTTAGSAIDTLLGVYEGTSVSNLTPVAANDDASAGETTSTVSFLADEGVTYRVAVDGKQHAPEQPDEGQILVHWTLGDAPEPAPPPPPPAPQTISFTTAPPATATVGGPTYAVAATATSGLPVTLAIDAGSASVCSLAGSTVSFQAAGTCTVNALQGGDSTFAAASAQQSFPVVRRSQTIVFASTPPPNAAIAGPGYLVAAASSSGLQVTLTIDPTAVSVCSFAGSTVTFIGVGTCTIDANEPGDSTFEPAAQVQQSFTVINPGNGGGGDDPAGTRAHLAPPAETLRPPIPVFTPPSQTRVPPPAR